MRGLLQLALDFLDGPHAEPQPSPSPKARVSPTATARPDAVPTPQGLTLEATPSHLTPPAPLDAAFTHPHANRQTRLGEIPVAYEFKRGRRRTIGMAVSVAGLTVSAPRWTPLHEVEAVLQEKASWIVRKLHEMQARQLRAHAARLEWRMGTELPWLGQSLTLVLARPIDPTMPLDPAGQTAVPSVPSSARVRARRMTQPVLETGWVTPSGEAGCTLRLDLPADAPTAQIRDAVHGWFLQEARALFAQRLDLYAPLLQVQWRKLALSNARTRWGSASSDGRIHLNWRLMHMPLAVIDYVVVHELSHLRVMDHSPRFWETVRSVMPDYERRRDQLRDVTLPVWSG
ncbi:M48 family peptidase [Hylemonella gracilis]|uniref:M48 family peptidase n=1 Tax=Hylemonella gracilis TaxID=80880 RepID=A0A4P6UHY6_9BURK|nr:SprT family zinc-dependent metalloprotease [Hylemonella gracilis]QBK03680.1 M48 family peptidase [Hylemonella gracilis]